MNLNLKPRLGACMGNGTFRAGSGNRAGPYWTQGSRGSYLGAGFFSATKHYFTANTNPARVYDPLRAYDIYADKQRIPYDQDAVANILRPHLEREDISLAERNALIAKLTEVIKANEAFEKVADDYYGARVSRTSGGKRDRLRAERAAVKGESAKARQIAAAGITDIRALKLAELKSKMSTDPDFVVSERDPASGGLVYALSTPAAQPSAQSQGNAMAWLLPVGAGLAAYLALKG